jgi:hypothetical protein
MRAAEEPSATARLNALLNEEARTRQAEWRTEYTDYYETTAQQYPRRATRQHCVYGAHAPSGPGVRRPPRFFDLAQTVDKYTPTERREMEESGVQHAKPWLGTSPGKWKAGGAGGVGDAPANLDTSDRQAPRALKSAPPRAPPSQHASPFFRHLDVLEQTKVQHPHEWKAASPRRWKGDEPCGATNDEPARRKTYTVSRS